LFTHGKVLKSFMSAYLPDWEKREKLLKADRSPAILDAAANALLNWGYAMPEYVMDEEGFIQLAKSAQDARSDAQTGPSIQSHGGRLKKASTSKAEDTGSRKCRHCGEIISYSEFASHMLHNHVRLKPDPTRIACPICGNRIKTENLDNHLSRTHHMAKEAAMDENTSPTSGPNS
jgi:hypothetical protein